MPTPAVLSVLSSLLKQTISWLTPHTLVAASERVLGGRVEGDCPTENVVHALLGQWSAQLRGTGSTGGACQALRY